MRTLYFQVALSLLLAIVPAYAQPSPSVEPVTEASVPDLKEDLFGKLQEHLQGKSEASAMEIIMQLAKSSTKSEDEIRTQITGWIGGLEKQRESKSTSWDAMISSGGDDIPKGKADKFLQYLLKETRKVVEGKQEGTFYIKDVVKRGAQKAGLMDFQGTDLLQKWLSMGSTPSAKAVEGKSGGKMGLIVEVRNQIKFLENLTPSLIEMFFATEGRAKDQIESIHTPSIPLLLQELPLSKFVKWAVTEPSPPLIPDHKLVLELDQFFFKGSLKPYPQPTILATVSLQDLASKAEVFNKSVEFHIVWMRDQGQVLEDQLGREIAQKTRELIGQVSAFGGQRKHALVTSVSIRGSLMERSFR